jgi:hypothetical protein
MGIACESNCESNYGACREATFMEIRESVLKSILIKIDVALSKDKIEDAHILSVIYESIQ